MNRTVSILLALFMILPFLQAAVPGCILKVTVLSPPKWYSASPVSPGSTNMLVNSSLKNIATGGDPSAGANVDLVLDNGSVIDLPAGPGTVYYSARFRETRKGLHAFGVNASDTGCLSDSMIQYYYYNESVVQGIPEFNPLLLPAVFLLALFAMRVGGRSRRPPAMRRL